MYGQAIMSEADHFLTVLFLTESAPGNVPANVLERVRDARMLPDRTYRIWGDADELGDVVRAMESCVELIENGMSAAAAPDCHDHACLAYDHDANVRLKQAARRLQVEIDDLDDYDRGDDDEAREGDLVDCGPEYPRNDAGEWLGRM